MHPTVGIGGEVQAPPLAAAELLPHPAHHGRILYVHVVRCERVELRQEHSNRRRVCGSYLHSQHQCHCVAVLEM